MSRWLARLFVLAVTRPGGFESVGTVYRDPKTGKLILIGRDAE